MLLCLQNVLPAFYSSFSSKSNEKGAIIFSLWCRWENWGIERLSKSPMIPQLVRTGRIQDCYLESDTRIHTLNNPASTGEGEAILGKCHGDCVSSYNVWFSHSDHTILSPRSIWKLLISGLHSRRMVLSEIPAIIISSVYLLRMQILGPSSLPPQSETLRVELRICVLTRRVWCYRNERTIAPDQLN